MRNRSFSKSSHVDKTRRVSCRDIHIDMRLRDIAEFLLRGTSTLYLFFSRNSRVHRITDFSLFYLSSRLSLTHSLYARTNKASGDKWRGRGINAARHKASPEHPSWSRRWRHWQWKVELWLKIEGLRKNSFKSTGGGDVRGRWRREVRPARERTSRERGPGRLTGVKYCLRGTRQLYDISEGHGRIPAKSLGASLARSLTIAFYFSVQSVQLFRDYSTKGST